MKWMKAKKPGPPKTPSHVWTALMVNLGFVLVALGGPRLFPDSDSAAMFFAIPMALILVVGAGAAIRAYILARRENRSLRWTAFLPLAVFLVGIVGTVFLVQADFAWTKPTIEVKPGQK